MIAQKKCDRDCAEAKTRIVPGGFIAKVSRGPNANCRRVIIWTNRVFEKIFQPELADDGPRL
jgi:hypothetical protein